MNCYLDHVCSSCVVKNCERRNDEPRERLKNLECDGNCAICDAAFSHHTDISDKIDSFVHPCPLYHLQRHHYIDFFKRIGEKPRRSNIEIINNRISKCHSCPYTPLCTLITKNAGWTVDNVKAHLNINWNFHNQQMLLSIPKDKLYAFMICDELQEQFKALQRKSLEDYLETIK